MAKVNLRNNFRNVCKDKVTNEAVREKTGSNTMQSTLKERRLRCLGQVHCVHGDIHTHGFPRTGPRKIEMGEKGRPHQS